MNKENNKRAFSLDALRGYAIITMVLSGTVASGILPGWMYHGQLPPPFNKFDPTVFGITWVDLVFPFFLFAMGAAFPFSIGRKYANGVSKLKLLWDSLSRGIELTFFAVFIQHMYPWITSSPQDTSSWLLALFSFALMFPMFMRLPWEMPEWLRKVIKLTAYGIAVFLLLTTSYANGRAFSLEFSNIIILVLANMAIFGSVVYIFTMNNRWARIAVLPFIMAVFLGSTTDGSWIKEVMNYTPLPWMYKFYYLKYLFIVIPGSIAGEYLLHWLRNRDSEGSENDFSSEKMQTFFVLLLSVGIIVFNLYGLYMRYLVLNLFGTVILLGMLFWLLRGKSNNMQYWRKLLVAGAYLLILGLFFEAYQGGIRKDDSTYSYYFVTSGLAFISMISFSIMCDIYRWRKITAPLEMAGKNPMIAYVATQLVVMPILNLTELAQYLSFLNQNAWLGFVRGVIITSLSVIIAMIFTKLRWFWRT